MRTASTGSLPACSNTNIAPVAFFDSGGAPGDYTGGNCAGLVGSYVKRAARTLNPEYDRLSAAQQKMVRMVIEESPLIEIITCRHLLAQLEALCPFLDFTDASLTVGDVSHELNVQNRASAGGGTSCEVSHGTIPAC